MSLVKALTRGKEVQEIVPMESGAERVIRLAKVLNPSSGAPLYWQIGPWASELPRGMTNILLLHGSRTQPHGQLEELIN